MYLLILSSVSVQLTYLSHCLANLRYLLLCLYFLHDCHGYLCYKHTLERLFTKVNPHHCLVIGFRGVSSS